MECSPNEERELAFLRQTIIGKWTKKYKDIKFTVGNGKNVKIFFGVKTVLAAASPVFEQMIFGNRTHSKIVDSISLPDIVPQAFDWFLKFTHGLNPHLNDKNVTGLYYLAQKYCIDNLAMICTNNIINNLNKKNYNLLNIMQDMAEYKLISQMSLILSKINCNVSFQECKQIFHSPTFLKLSELMIIEWFFKGLNIQSIVGYGNTFLVIKHWCENNAPIIKIDNDNNKCKLKKKNESETQNYNQKQQKEQKEQKKQ